MKGKALLVEGKPFFPFGLFCTGWTRAEIRSCLKDVQSRGFNTVHSYWAADVCRSQETVRLYLDEAQRRGLKVLPTIGSLGEEATLFREGKLVELERRVQGWIRPFRKHPALLAWYVWDEPNAEGFAATPECVRAVSEYVKREDPDHPTFFTFTPWHRLETLADYATCCDILCLDPYVFRDYMGLVPNSLDKAVDHAQGRPLWSLLWACWNSGSRAPTVDEMRCSTYLSLIHGATGILHYGHLSEPAMRSTGDTASAPKGARWQLGIADPLMRSQYDAVSQLGREVREIAPALLAPSPPDAEVSTDQRTPNLHCRSFRDGKGIVLLAANMSKEAATVQYRIHSRRTVGAVKVLFSSGRLEVKDGTFEDRLEPLGTRAYRIPLVGG